MGRATLYNTRGVSIVDYCICSASLLHVDKVIAFEVGEFCPLLSDHIQLKLTLQTFVLAHDDMELHDIQPCKCTQTIEDQFITKLNDAKTDNKRKINEGDEIFTQTLKVAAGFSVSQQTRVKVKKKIQTKV